MFRFVQGKFDPPLHLLDVVQIHRKERDRHRWQRPLEEVLHFTKYLTRPGDWILDPMAGSFATGRAAVILGRNYLGVDIDRKAVAKGRAWLEQA
jgi:site-specific DNA-methyltransferase (adenine-specific)